MQYIDILDVNIYHLQLFIYTVECGSMTKAAHLAHVSQSMLSKTISKLEQKFGLQLFVRKNNGLSVTPAGKILYDEAVKLKDLWSWLWKKRILHRRPDGSLSGLLT